MKFLPRALLSDVTLKISFSIFFSALYSMQRDKELLKKQFLTTVKQQTLKVSSAEEKEMIVWHHYDAIEDIKN